MTPMNVFIEPTDKEHTEENKNAWALYLDSDRLPPHSGRAIWRPYAEMEL